MEKKLRFNFWPVESYLSTSDVVLEDVVLPSNMIPIKYDRYGKPIPLMLVSEHQALIAPLVEALTFYASYMDGENPEFTKGGWQKYPDPKIAKQALENYKKQTGEGK